MEGIDEVRVDLLESELRSPGLEEREVESRAVERDDHGGFRDRSGELVEVDALDELPHSVAVMEADKGDVVAVPPQAGRLDVQEDGPVPPFPDRPPLVFGPKPSGEIPVVAGLEALAGALDLLSRCRRPLTPAAESRVPAEELVPRPEALPPEARL